MSLYSATGWQRKPARETLDTTVNAALLPSFVQRLYSAQQTGTLMPGGEGAQMILKCN